MKLSSSKRRAAIAIIIKPGKLMLPGNCSVLASVKTSVLELSHKTIAWIACLETNSASPRVKTIVLTRLTRNNNDSAESKPRSSPHSLLSTLETNARMAKKAISLAKILTSEFKMKVAAFSCTPKINTVAKPPRPARKTINKARAGLGSLNAFLTESSGFNILNSTALNIRIIGI